MYVIRRAKIEDVPTLLKLARMVYFTNLPADKDIISQKISLSRGCFMRVAGRRTAETDLPASKPRRGQQIQGLGDALSETDLFMFVLEDTETGSCLGSSQVLAEMGGPHNPNVSFKLTRREKFSKTLHTGTSHIIAKLHLDSSGPTEIGGLILQPSYRGHRRKLGRFLSLVRFHFIGLHRELFADRVLAEMMAPITHDGLNLLWEYLGRRFIPLSYTEADRFCQYSREFMTALLPRDEIYLSLLPPEARAVVGEVNKETVPARRMLEKLGFEYKHFIDPFDGGPHLEAQTDEIELVAQTLSAPFGDTARVSQCVRWGIISVLDADGEFRSVEDHFALDAKGRVILPREIARKLGVQHGDKVGLSPTDKKGPITRAKATRAAARSKSTKKSSAKASAARSNTTSKKTART